VTAGAALVCFFSGLFAISISLLRRDKAAESFVLVILILTKD
jgi:hypothetical protein